MTLRKKTILATAGTFVLAAATLYITTQTIVLGGFERLEQDRVLTNVGRVERAIEESSFALQSFCSDWSGWDDTRDFIQGKFPQYAGDNLQDLALVNPRLNFMAYLDIDGNVVHTKCVDLKEKVGVDCFEDLQLITSQPALLKHSGPRDSKTGIMMVPRGPVLVSACPVTNNSFDGPISGTLIVGRFVDDDEIWALSKRTQLTVSLVPAGQPDAPEDVRRAQTMISPETPRAVLTDGREKIRGYSMLRDIAGNSAAVVRIEEPRAIYQQGLATARFFSGLLSAVGLVVCLILFTGIERNVLRPLAALQNHVIAIRETNDLTRSVEVSSDDEIGELAQAFNEMTDSLRATQAELGATHVKLLEAARLAGMADVASGVLHNVGNVLNSVNIATTTAIREASEMRIPNLARAIEMVEQNKDDLGRFLTQDERGSKLPAYFSGLAKSLTEQQESVVGRLTDLEAHVQHIAQIISLQQSVAKKVGVVEPVELPPLVENAITISSSALARHGVQVDRQFPPLPRLMLDRHQVLQILVNLISNAKYALRDVEREDKRISIRIAKQDSAPRVRVSVTDNGVGIPPENLERIFAHGFTTRADGHGFGLHTAALAAKQLDGALIAQSEGPGKGAVFILELPYKEA